MQLVGTVAELILIDGSPAARILCDPAAIPAPGQYLLARAADGTSVLADEVFAATLLTDGFIAEPPARSAWRPGARLFLRGPLGNGFTIPHSARRVALIAWDKTPRRLLALVERALQQEASVTLVCDDPPYDLPLQVEVQPFGALADVCTWSDYAAFDVLRDSLWSMRSRFADEGKSAPGGEAEVLVRVPMPCGGLGECGVCTVKTRRGPRLVCVDGPVIDFRLLVPER